MDRSAYGNATLKVCAESKNERAHNSSAGIVLILLASLIDAGLL